MCCILYYEIIMYTMYYYTISNTYQRHMFVPLSRNHCIMFMSSYCAAYLYVHS